MSDMTINQVREKRNAAELQISEILSRLARDTGLSIRGVSVAPNAAATRKVNEADKIGAAITAAMQSHVDATIHLEAL